MELFASKLLNSKGRTQINCLLAQFYVFLVVYTPGSGTFRNYDFTTTEINFLVIDKKISFERGLIRPLDTASNLFVIPVGTERGDCLDKYTYSTVLIIFYYVKQIVLSSRMKMFLA